MSWQKAAGARGDSALSAIKRYVGVGACYHQFPGMSLVGNPANRGNSPILGFFFPQIQRRTCALYRMYSSPNFRSR